jgi:hypothetical protein
MQVVAYADGNVQAAIDIEPGGNNWPVIDAMYAFLDDFIGANHGPGEDDPGDDGGGEEPKPPHAVDRKADTPTQGTA